VREPGQRDHIPPRRYCLRKLPGLAPALKALPVMAVAADAYHLELFARRLRPGWASWGNEIESTIRLSPVPLSPPLRNAVAGDGGS
jgi:hypothetical protein